MMRARVFAPLGIAPNASGGLVSAPSQVYLDGIDAPSLKAALEIFIDPAPFSGLAHASTRITAVSVLIFASLWCVS